MFGWEFPPNISGGLGTACLGLTTSLIKQNVDVIFVVPKLFGDEEKNQLRFINATNIKINIEDPYYLRLIERLNYIEVDSEIAPYLSPKEYSLKSKNNLEEFRIKKESSNKHFNFSGLYGNDLMKEVRQYALVAAKISIKNNFDIIHAHDWLTYPAGIIAKKKSGKPLIIHVHATEFDRSGENINKAVYDIEKKGMQEADAIIAVSKYTKQIIMEKYGINEKKIKVVYNGVLATNYINENFFIKNKNRKVVTFLGRITFQKGPEYFIQAAKKVIEKYPDTYFVMAGNGDMFTHMIKQVAALRLSSRFHFTGFLKGKDTDKMYLMSDVYVMPSVSEPFGISPLEAARLGVPVIISKQSGVSEVLKNVIKIDFWDIDAMADAICGLLNYNALAKTFKREANKEIKILNWDTAALNTKMLYQSLT
jgi:glycosyltransferase involved in cell wall biosynthesis